VNEPIQVHYLKIDETLSWMNMHPLNLTVFNTLDPGDSDNFVDYFTYS